MSRQFSELGNAIIESMDSMTDAQDDAWRNFFEALDERLSQSSATNSGRAATASAQVAGLTPALASFQQSKSSIRGGGTTPASDDAGDSGSYPLLKAQLASGQTVQPGFAVRVENSLMYAAKATDWAYRCDGIMVRSDADGNYLYRNGGSTQCLLTGTGIVGNTVYLSTVAGKLTTDMTESTGGTRVILQPIGKLEALVKTAIGTTGLCRVSLTIQEAQNA